MVITTDSQKLIPEKRSYGKIDSGKKVLR